MYNSVIFSVFRKFCSCSHSLIYYIFITPKRNCPTPRCPPCLNYAVLGNHYSTFCFRVSRIIQCVVSFTLCVFKVHQCCSMYWSFFFFCQIIFHLWIYQTLFIILWDTSYFYKYFLLPCESSLLRFLVYF